MKMSYETHGHKSDIDDIDISPSGDRVSFYPEWLSADL